MTGSAGRPFTPAAGLHDHFRLKQIASTSSHAAADAMHRNYDRAERSATAPCISWVCLAWWLPPLIVLTAVMPARSYRRGFVYRGLLAMLVVGDP
jgi:hypothetical protein